MAVCEHRKDRKHSNLPGSLQSSRQLSCCLNGTVRLTKRMPPQQLTPTTPIPELLGAHRWPGRYATGALYIGPAGNQLPMSMASALRSGGRTLQAFLAGRACCPSICTFCWAASLASGGAWRFWPRVSSWSALLSTPVRSTPFACAEALLELDLEDLGQKKGKGRHTLCSSLLASVEQPLMMYTSAERRNKPVV